MAYQTPVPAQSKAVRYLEDTVVNSEFPFARRSFQGGKPGDYAAVMCRADLKSNILEVYNNDGPGSMQNIKSNAYAEMRGAFARSSPIVCRRHAVGARGWRLWS